MERRRDEVTACSHFHFSQPEGPFPVRRCETLDFYCRAARMKLSKVARVENDQEGVAANQVHPCSVPGMFSARFPVCLTVPRRGCKSGIARYSSCGALQGRGRGCSRPGRAQHAMCPRVRCRPEDKPVSQRIPHLVGDLARRFTTNLGQTSSQQSSHSIDALCSPHCFTGLSLSPQSAPTPPTAWLCKL